MNPLDLIESFVRQVRDRLNRHLLFNVIIGSLVTVCVLTLLVAGFYILRGHAVPASWYGWALLSFLLAVGIGWLVRRHNVESASHFADTHYGLKDSITSLRDFRERHQDGEFVALQTTSTADRVTELSPEAISWQAPTRWLVLGAVLLVSVVLTAFRAPSDAVLEQMALEEQTAERTEEVNEFLKDLVEQMDTELQDPEARELVNPERLRELMGQLEKTSDQKEALRQYARLEAELMKAAQRLDQRAEEQLLARAGEELEKDAPTREMGRQMRNQEYRQAAQALQDMKPSPRESQKASEQRREMAKLKSAAQRMAAAARASRSSEKGSQSPGQQGQQSKSGQSSSGQGSEGSTGQGQSQGGGKSLDQMLSDLDQQVQDYDQALDRSQSQPNQGQDSSESQSQLSEQGQKLSNSMNQLGDKMGRMQTRKEAQEKLQSLSQSLSQCQSFLCDKPGGSKPGEGGGKDGQGVGSATLHNSRNALDLLLDNGNTSRLQGIKGSGPSEKTTEQAEDGSGEATLMAVEQEREFQRQMESFVRREDVPEEVKEGVKLYFETIHQVSPSTEE